MYNQIQYQDPYMNMGQNMSMGPGMGINPNMPMPQDMGMVQNMSMNPNDERFFVAPFLLGGLAGGALGYGIAANNNQGSYYPSYPVPVYPAYPMYTCPNCPNTTNNYYYQ